MAYYMVEFEGQYQNQVRSWSSSSVGLFFISPSSDVIMRKRTVFPFKEMPLRTSATFAVNVLTLASHFVERRSQFLPQKGAHAK